MTAQKLLDLAAEYTQKKENLEQYPDMMGEHQRAELERIAAEYDDTLKSFLR